jgi:hypothetical protein
MAHIREWGNLLVLGRQRLLGSEKLGYELMVGYSEANAVVDVTSLALKTPSQGSMSAIAILRQLSF